MKIGTRGLSALFDAFLFLTVASLVSTLMVGFQVCREEGERIEEFVDRSHRAILRATVEIAEGGETSTLRLSEFLSWSSLGQGDRYLDQVKPQVEEMMDGLFIWHSWSWECLLPEPIELGNGTPPEGAQVWSSEISLPLHEGDTVCRLMVWPTLTH
ncbi:MAG: hypothetical protein ACLFPN_06355 [Methanomassiliicoccales archaeon]